jgi:tRNA-2-methylthio-N6-dimethylallyladenosine synthase
MSKESKGYKKMPKKIYIRTFGCQMNDRDSEALLGLFLQKGYKQAIDEKDADIILVNTCSVREHAEHRVMSILGTLKKLSAVSLQSSANRKNKAESRKLKAESSKIIGLIGCMAKNHGEEIFRKMPHISLVCSPSVADRIVDYVEDIIKTGQRIIDLDDRSRDEEFYVASYRIEPGHASVVISTGCSNYCSYCVVPFVRGEIRPRSPNDIVNEIKRNISLGIKKITLLGQNVNDYTYRRHSSSDLPTSFIDLLKMVERIEGIEEVDFITAHPKNTSEKLFEIIAKSKKIKKHLHLPYQSGSDRILQLMNRGYTNKEYLELIKKYKKIVKGTLSTDAIVGFPTETKQDFLKTKDVLEKVKFKVAYIFKYSPRPQTKAQMLKDDVPQKVKEERHAKLLALQKKLSSLEAPSRGQFAD